MTPSIATTSVAPGATVADLECRESGRTNHSGRAEVAASGPGVTGANGRGRQMLGWLENAGLLLRLALGFFPVILVVGTPVALVVRLVLGIARRSF
jgi:hypothetical protein